METTQLLELLSSLQGDSPSNSGALTEMLLKQSGDNPRLQLLAALLAQNQQAETAPDEGDTVEQYEDQEEAALEAARRRRQATRLKGRIRHMVVELEELRHRNQTFAQALGACYRCWGTDSDCVTCGGQGGPGATEPNRLLLSQLVGPALKSLRKGGTNEKRQTVSSDY